VRKLSTVAAAAALVSCVVAPASAQDSQELVIGAVYLDAQGFYAGVRKGVQDAGAEIGANLQIIETNAQGDLAKESSFIDRLVSSGVQAIILSAVSADGSVAAIERAHEAGIPVVCYNTCINPDDMKEFVYAYAVGDPFQFGHDLGAFAATYFKDNGIAEPKIGVLNCEFVEVCVQRRLGFEAALKEAGVNFTIVSNQEGTILDNAISVGEAMLTANPEINALFGESGGASLGAAMAIRNRDMVGKAVVFGSDMTTELAEELIQGDVIKAQVDVSGKSLGAMALREAVDAINGVEQTDVIVPHPIDLYTSPEQGKAWIEAHPDGLP